MAELLHSVYNTKYALGCVLLYYHLLIFLSNIDPGNSFKHIPETHREAFAIIVVPWCRLFHAPTRTTSSGCVVLHRTVNALWNLYGNLHKNRAEQKEECTVHTN